MLMSIDPLDPVSQKCVDFKNKDGSDSHLENQKITISLLCIDQF